MHGGWGGCGGQGDFMRRSSKLFACALFAAFAYSETQADGLNNKTPWAVRQPSGPVDKGLGGDAKEKPAADSSAAKSGSAANQNVVSGIAPPVAPASVEEAAPTVPVETKELNPDGTLKTQALAGDQGAPIWQNRWLWALLAIVLIVTAGIVEWQGRKRDEALAAEEPQDAPLKA
jgi:hypothetical protein